MKKRMLLLLCLVFVALPISALAQDDDLIETTTEDGFFTVSIPEGWVAVTYEDVSLVIATSEEVGINTAGGKTVNAASLEAGEAALLVTVLPTEHLEAMLNQLTPEQLETEADNPIVFFMDDSTPAEMAQKSINFFNSLEGTHLEAGDPEIVELTEDLEAGVISFKTETSEGLVVVFKTEESAVIALALTPLEEGETLQETVVAILASLEVDPSYAASIMENANQ